MKRALLCCLLWLVSAAALASGLLRPEDAFRPSVRALDGATLELRFEVAAGYYLYRDKFRFTADPATVRLGPAVFPPGKEKMDETFGRVEVFTEDVAIRVPVVRDGAGVLPLTLRVVSQGCAEAGVCYPPQQQTLQVELPDPATTPIAPPPVADESGRIARLLAGSGPVWVALSFFGFGVLLSLTPCTLPMVPILSGIIVGVARRGSAVQRPRALTMSLSYVFGMAVTYAAAGAAAGLTGTLLSSALQNVWVLSGFALMFVVLALAMFGLFEFQMPGALQSRISGGTARLGGGSLAGVALLGALSSLIVGPCVAAPLAGALLYIGRTGDALLGGMALFCLALGMGVPLVVAGVSAGALLPKAGAWMSAVNRAFGVMLLATALWIVSPILPVAVQLFGWAALCIVPAIFLRAIDPLPPQARGVQRFGKALGVILLLLGAAMLVGALSGARDPWQPLSGLRGGAAVAPLPFARVRSLGELDARLAASGRPAMLDFYADWCVSCKEMERDTFSDPRVREALSGWLLLQVDVTGNTAEDRALLKRFELFGPPGIVFFDPRGQEVSGVRVVGPQSPAEFLATLSAARR